MEALGDAEPRSAGRYRLIAELGRGGMGRVLLAAGPDGRLVAVKRVHPQLAAVYVPGPSLQDVVDVTPHRRHSR